MARFNRDHALLELIVELIAHIERRVGPLKQDMFLGDRDEVDLTSFRLLHIGEATHKLSADLKARHPAIQWSAIHGMRNVISHDYVGTEGWLIWQAATTKLDELLDMCRIELARIGE